MGNTGRRQYFCALPSLRVCRAATILRIACPPQHATKWSPISTGAELQNPGGIYQIRIAEVNTDPTIPPHSLPGSLP